MTSKDYIKIAEVFRAAKPERATVLGPAKDVGEVIGRFWEAEQHNILLHKTMEMLKADNKRFDRTLFLEAAGGYAAKE